MTPTGAEIHSHAVLSHSVTCPLFQIPLSLILSAILGVRLSSLRRSIPQRSEGPNVHSLVKKTPHDTDSGDGERFANRIAIRGESALDGGEGMGHLFCRHVFLLTTD
jgi:hypothetical protein